MTQPLVLVKHPQQGWLLIHRALNQVVNLSEAEAKEIKPDEAIRRTVSTGFVAASYEIIELCNLSCIHCYLNGVRQRSPLSLNEQLQTIDRIEQAGVLWLQISGGEPLSTPGFSEVYRHAWDQGFMITALTNGTLLNRPDIASLFRDRPPFRISVSIYGATKETYERVTDRPGSWELFQAGILAAREAGYRLRMKVIELAENSHELDAMLEIAQQGEEHDHVREIIPTLAGDLSPRTHQTNEQVFGECWSECEAGTGSFHVRADGMACLCKITREPAIPLTQLDKLVQLAPEILRRPSECLSCPKQASCHVCPSLYRLLTIQSPQQPCVRR